MKSGERFASGNGETINPLRRLMAVTGVGAMALGLVGCGAEEERVVAVAPIEVQDEASVAAEDALESVELDCDYDEMLEGYGQPGAGENVIDYENSACDGSVAVLRFGNDRQESNVYVFEAKNDTWRLEWNNSGGANLDCTPENMSEEIRAATPECEYNYE